MRLGSGKPSIDFNGTKYTSIEGSAANSEISIGKRFDPLKTPGIALTTQQAKELGVKVGDKVLVRDTKTGRTVEATFYDSAGGKRKDKLDHFEVSPALADSLGINYRNKKGQVVDAVTNKENLEGRFSIEKLNGTSGASPTEPTSNPTRRTEFDPTQRASATRLGAFDNRYHAEPSVDALSKGAKLAIGDKGEAVRELQRKLGVKADGYFGPITQRALAQAQKKLGIENGSPDFGVAGREMIDRLPTRRRRVQADSPTSEQGGTTEAPRTGETTPGSPRSASRLVDNIRQIEREMGGTGRCAAAVNEAIRRTYRVPMSGNGNQVDNNLPRSHFRELNISLEEALKRPGLVLTWERTNTRLGSRYGHTAITTGDGHTSVSDYTEGNTIAGSQRMGRQGLRVFEPIQ